MSTIYHIDNPAPENGHVTPFVVSFEDHFKALSLPAIDFGCGDEALTFIIDSGSDVCYINRTTAGRLGLKIGREETEEGKERVIGTGNGIAKSSGESCEAVLSLDNYKFNVRFLVEDFDSLAAFLKNNGGVTVHGILGTNFLASNNWQIDFMHKVAYPVFKLN
ncbi:MAG: retroviral-like aspartic protease [Bacteroidales bacterium]|nr:retroviral-like aspartic protease [Bacteroidales bacterium]